MKDRTLFWNYVGIGIMVLLVGLGIGSCCRLSMNSEKPLIEIQYSKP